MRRSVPWLLLAGALSLPHAYRSVVSSDAYHGLKRELKERQGVAYFSLHDPQGIDAVEIEPLHGAIGSFSFASYRGVFDKRASFEIVGLPVGAHAFRVLVEDKQGNREERILGYRIRNAERRVPEQSPGVLGPF